MNFHHKWLIAWMILQQQIDSLRSVLITVLFFVISVMVCNVITKEAAAVSHDLVYTYLLLTDLPPFQARLCNLQHKF